MDRYGLRVCGSSAPISRRFAALLALASPLLATGAGQAQPVRRTPSATEGPYYPTPAMRFADTDNDLVKVAGAAREAAGEAVWLKGRVILRNGMPAKGVRVEIWQCDAGGRYLHRADRGATPRDPAFQGFGQTLTDAEGGYRFRTIRPVPYTGRTPHIHVKVFHGGGVLTTQFYVDGLAENARDGLYASLGEADRRSVSMTFKPGAGGSEATVDIHL